MDPYESEFSNRIAAYWAILWMYIVCPGLLGVAIVLLALGVL